MKYDDLFNAPENKVKKKKIILEDGTEVYQFTSKKIDTSDILFIEIENKTYEPYMYNFKKSENNVCEAKVISRGTILYDFIQSIHYTEIVYNSKTKKNEYNNLTILQWVYAIRIITSALKYSKARHEMEVTRQFGKSHIMTKIAGFLPVFAPLYADLMNDKWWQIISSYSDDSVVEIFDLKVKPIILKNIELFNKMYPNSPLIYGRGKDRENLVNDKNKIEIKRLIGNKPEPYSYIVAISTNTVKDGKSCDWMWCDEAWRTDAKEFRRGILPFLGSTGGDLVISGITTTDTNSLQYGIHFEEKKCISFIGDCFIVYNYLLMDSPKRAENLRSLAEEEFDYSGIDSTESQSNYLMTWDILESGKFYTLDLLRKNKNFSKKEELLKYDDINRDYRVMGLDLATIQDYCVATIWDVYKTEKIEIENSINKNIYKPAWKTILRDVIIYNIDKKPISAERVAELVSKDCNSLEIDMIMCDGTSHQRTHNEWIYKKLLENNTPTFLCPYDFSGDKNKVMLMTHFEQSLRSSLVVLGSELEIEKHEGFSILYKEIIKLYKGAENGKKNIQWKAKGRGNTDDCVMSSALGVYCVPFIEWLQKENKFIEINSYRYRARLNKFKNNNSQNKTNDWKQVRYANVL